MPLTREYEEFLRGEVVFRKLAFYEKICHLAGRILPIPPPKFIEKQYQEAIEFSHLKITPKQAFSLAILISTLILVIPSVIAIILGFPDAVTLSIILGFIAFFYMYDYPLHYSTLFKIRATSEMVLSVLYITISMRISPNIENAIKFAAGNLKGPLALDFKQLLWDVYTRRYDSMSAALDNFILKWKKDNDEFTQAINLIKLSSYESQEKLERSLDEAVEVILNGTKERMEHFAQDLRTPVTVFNALGILLPILALVFLPIVGIFLQDAIKPFWLTIGYDILLPFSVYIMMKSYMEKRPYSFHHPDISSHPRFSRENPYGKPFILSIVTAVLLSSIGLFFMIQSTEIFSFSLLIYSMLVTWGISGGIVIYTLMTTYKKLELRNEVAQIENEFAEGLFQLGTQLTRGIPLERAIKDITPRIKELKISKFFETILYNIETFGMTLEQAVLDKRTGAIRYYPSQTIEAVMKAMVEISKKGMGVVANAMITISKYLKDMHKVQEDLKETMGETTSTMEIQAYLLAPLASGIVVALAAMVMQMLVNLRQSIESLQSSLFSGGAVEAAGGGILSSIINIDQIIPTHYFQLIVGIYMIEMVSILAIFLSAMNNGEESLLRKFNLGKTLGMATIIYSLTLLGVYMMFASIIPAAGVFG
ncbi:MAG: hypothetical protein HY361_03665 [Candidatus Aenigmarchaeota archaeon]|nr:hypothetical protein [Candidatus Aenigmarchaeota archaeon]